MYGTHDSDAALTPSAQPSSSFLATHNCSSDALERPLIQRSVDLPTLRIRHCRTSRSPSFRLPAQRSPKAIMSESTCRSCPCAICCKHDAHKTELKAQLPVADEDHLPLRIHSPRSDINHRDSIPHVDGSDMELTTSRTKRAVSLQFPTHRGGQGALAFAAGSRPPCCHSLDNQTSSGTSSSRSAPASELTTPIQASSPNTALTHLAAGHTIQRGERIIACGSAPACGLRRSPTSSAPMRQSASSISARSDPGPSFESTPALFSPLIHSVKMATSVPVYSPFVTAPPLASSQAIQQTEGVAARSSFPAPRPTHPPTSSSSPPVRRSAGVASSSDIRLRRRAASGPVFTPSKQASDPHAAHTRAPAISSQAIQQAENVATSRSAPTSEPPPSSSSPPIWLSASGVASNRGVPGLPLRSTPTSTSGPIHFPGIGAAAQANVQASSPRAAHTPLVVPQGVRRTGITASRSASPPGFRNFPTSPSSPLARQTASVASNKIASAPSPYGAHLSSSGSPIRFSVQVFNFPHHSCFSIYLTHSADQESDNCARLPHFFDFFSIV